MHHIQRKILSLLMHSPALNYAQMRPRGVESNHFAYHLDQLVRAGYIAKEGRSYTLTAEGLALADRVSHGDMTVRKQPHIVTAVRITNDAGQTLLFTHSFHPYMGLTGFPQGRTHYDEHIREAAARELFEKTGLQDVPLRHRGMVYIHASKQDVEISKILAHLFTGTVQGTPEVAPQDPQKGSCSWAVASTYSDTQCMPGFSQVNALLEASGDLFFAEIEAVMS